MPAKGMNIHYIHLQLDVHQGLQRFDTSAVAFSARWPWAQAGYEAMKTGIRPLGSAGRTTEVLPSWRRI